MKVMDAYVIKINLSHQPFYKLRLELLTTKHKSATEAIKSCLLRRAKGNPNPKVLD